MQFIPLSHLHRDSLLSFESENRAYFESFIAPRGDEFYSEAGITAHIDSMLDGVKAGESFAGVLLQDNRILARGNLRNINCETGEADVGYRVGAAFAGQGLASFCLQQLIEKARTIPGLTRLHASVLDNNPASTRVLTKQGFILSGRQEQFARIQNVSLDVSHYTLAWAPA